jgi:hypothetical protein
MIYNVIAICRTESCEANGIENRFEVEDPNSMSVLCGPCQVVIIDVTVSEA